MSEIGIAQPSPEEEELGIVAPKVQLIEDSVETERLSEPRGRPGGSSKK